MYSRLVLLVGLIALAGCGGGTKTVVQTQTVAAPPATTATTPPATTTATTPQATSGGGVGRSFVLVGSEFAHVPKGKTSGPRDKISAQVTGVVDPITGYDNPKSSRIVGIKMTVKNVGSVKYVDFQPSGDLTLVGGGAGKAESLISTGPEACKDPSLKLAPGASGQVCMAFQVPASAKLQSFQYTSDLGDGQSAVWKLS